MKSSQCERIIQYINECGSITQMEALKELGCFRLASRINDLKRKGYNIRRDMITVKNRYNEPVQIARYKIESNV